MFNQLSLNKEQISLFSSSVMQSDERVSIQPYGAASIQQ